METKDVRDPAGFRRRIEEAMGFAAAEDRAALAGVRIEVVGTVVSTDGHRLHARVGEHPFGATSGLFLHRSDFDRFLRVFAGGRRCGRVTASRLGADWQLLRTDGKTKGATVTLRANHPYPDWHQIAQSAFDSESTLRLTGPEVDRLSALADDMAGVASGSVVVSLYGPAVALAHHRRTDSGMRVGADGEVRTDEAVEGPGATLSINPRYFASVLRGVGEKGATLRFSADNRGPFHVITTDLHRGVMPLTGGAE